MSTPEPSTSLREAVARRHLLTSGPTVTFFLVDAFTSPNRSPWQRWLWPALLVVLLLLVAAEVRRARRGLPVKDDERPMVASLYWFAAMGLLWCVVMVMAAMAATAADLHWLGILPAAWVVAIGWLVVDQRRALRRWNVEVGPYPEPPPSRYFTPRDDDPR